MHLWLQQVAAYWPQLPTPRIEAMWLQVDRLLDGAGWHAHTELAPLREALLDELNRRVRQERRAA